MMVAHAALRHSSRRAPGEHLLHSKLRDPVEGIRLVGGEWEIAAYSKDLRDQPGHPGRNPNNLGKSSFDLFSLKHIPDALALRNLSSE